MKQGGRPSFPEGLVPVWLLTSGFGEGSLFVGLGVRCRLSHLPIPRLWLSCLLFLSTILSINLGLQTLFTFFFTGAAGIALSFGLCGSSKTFETMAFNLE